MRKLTFIVVLFCTTMSASRAGNLRYSVPANPWPEHFGNHRAVVRIAHPASAVHIRLPWRRHDPDPELRHLLVVEASAGDTLANIRRTQVTNEVCDIVVGPVNRRGLYFLYYLPYTVQSGWGFFGGSYLPPESPPDSSWVRKIGIMGSRVPTSIPLAEVIEIQSRTEFDSFFPMEIVPSRREKEEYLRRHPAEYLLFPEDRAFPIRMRDGIPLKWIAAPPQRIFGGSALRKRVRRSADRTACLAKGFELGQGYLLRPERRAGKLHLRSTHDLLQYSRH